MFRKFFKTAIFWSIIIVLGLMFLNGLGLLEGPKNLVYGLMSPSQNTSSEMAFKISHFFSFFTDKNELIIENQELIEENQGLQTRLVDLKELKNENIFLRQQLDLPESEKKKIVLVSIIGQEPTNLGEYLIINKGANDGISKDNAVIVSNNILVGRVLEVNSKTAKVLLITDSSSLVNVVVQENRTKGIIKGKKQSELVMDLILQEENIELEQKIITSGLAGIYPKGLLIGEVEKIVSSDPQIFQQAKIRPAVNFNNLERVFVIID